MWRERWCDDDVLFHLSFFYSPSIKAGYSKRETKRGILCFIQIQSVPWVPPFFILGRYDVTGISLFPNWPLLVWRKCCCLGGLGFFWSPMRAHTKTTGQGARLNAESPPPYSPSSSSNTPSTHAWAFGGEKGEKKYGRRRSEGYPLSFNWIYQNDREYEQKLWTERENGKKFSIVREKSSVIFFLFSLPPPRPQE